MEVSLNEHKNNSIHVQEIQIIVKLLYVFI